MPFYSRSVGNDPPSDQKEVVRLLFGGGNTPLPASDQSESVLSEPRHNVFKVMSRIRSAWGLPESRLRVRCRGQTYRPICGIMADRRWKRLRLFQEPNDVLAEPEPGGQGRLTSLEPNGSWYFANVKFDSVGFQSLVPGRIRCNGGTQSRPPVRLVEPASLVGVTRPISSMGLYSGRVRGRWSRIKRSWTECP